MIRRSIFGLPANTQFTDIWENPEVFLADYKESGIYQFSEECRLSDEEMKLLYFLLYSRYGNNSINSFDRNRFKYNLFTIVFQYGPTWSKRLEIQDKIRNLSDSDIFKGSKVIYNHAFNPGTQPSTATLEELTAINEQTTNNYIKSKIEGYALQWELLKPDVTNEFLNRFQKLFQQVVAPGFPLVYVEDEDREEV